MGAVKKATAKLVKKATVHKKAAKKVSHKKAAKKVSHKKVKKAAEKAVVVMKAHAGNAVRNVLAKALKVASAKPPNLKSAKSAVLTSTQKDYFQLPKALRTRGRDEKGGCCWPPPGSS